MLKILLYHSFSQVQEYFTHQASALKEKLLIVTPGPVKADALRSHWPKGTGEVLTIAGYLTRLSEERLTASQKRLSKSELMTYFFGLKCHHPLYHGASFGEFKNAFNAYTELKSYFAKPPYPDELLQEYPETVAELLRLFAYVGEQQEILDEQGLYYKLISVLNTQAFAQEQVVVFSKFTFLAPAQLQFIDSLSLHVDVVIPLPHQVWTHLTAWDWPHYFSSPKELIELPLLASTYEKKQIEVREFHQIELSHALEKVLFENKENNAQWIVATKELTSDLLHSLPSLEGYFEYPVDLLSAAIDSFFSTLMSVDKKLTTEAWEQHFLERKLKKIHPSFQRAQELKIISLILPHLELLKTVVPNSWVWGHDFFSLLKEVVSLDAPRVKMFPLLESNEATYELFDLSQLMQCQPQIPRLWIVCQRFASLKSDHRPLRPSVEKILAALGPIKGPELEYQFLKAEMEECFHHHQSSQTVLIEKGVIQINEFWQHLLSPFYSAQLREENKKKSIHIKERGPAEFELPSVLTKNKISASSLQDYSDCPRKYAFRKMIPQPLLASSVESSEQGEWQHQFFAYLWNHHRLKPLSQGELINITKEFLTTFFSKKNISFSQEDYQIVEISQTVWEAIKKLSLWMMSLPGAQVSFEVPLEHPFYHGRVDCLIESEDHFIVLDFKRSFGDHPSFSTWISHTTKVQLWFYLLAFPQKLKKKSIGAGYLFFRDPEKSWLAVSDGEQPSKEHGLYLWERPQEMLEQKKIWIEDTIARWKSDEDYGPNSLSAQVCEYCRLATICEAAKFGSQE